MFRIFYKDYWFNQPLNDWNVASVNDIEYMFRGATKFNLIYLRIVYCCVGKTQIHFSQEKKSCRLRVLKLKK